MSGGDDVELEVAPELTAEMKAVIGDGLSEYNRVRTGYVDGRDLAVILRQAGTRAILGGLLGRTTLGLMFIDLVYLPDAARGRGVHHVSGARVLSASRLCRAGPGGGGATGRHARVHDEAAGRVGTGSVGLIAAGWAQSSLE